MSQLSAITNDGQLGFVALSGGQVDMLDIPGRSIVNTISVGGQPHFIITGPYPPPDVPIPQPTATSPRHLSLLGLTAALLIGAFAGIGWFIWRKWKKRPSF